MPLPTEITVRHRTPEDLDACAAVLRRVHEHDRYPVRWPTDPVAFLTPEDELVAWVACRAGDLVGHVMLANPPAELVTATSIDGRPARSDDLATAEATARARRPVLEVLSVNVNAIALYDRAGWSAIGSTTPDWAPDRSAGQTTSVSSCSSSA